MPVDYEKIQFNALVANLKKQTKRQTKKKDMQHAFRYNSAWLSHQTHLGCKVHIFLFVFSRKVVPPFTQNLTHSPVILVRVFLMNKSPVTLAKDHKGIHWTANMFLLLLGLITRCLAIKKGQMSNYQSKIVSEKKFCQLSNYYNTWCNQAYQYCLIEMVTYNSLNIMHRILHISHKMKGFGE